MTSLAQLTTLRVGGPAREYLEVDTEQGLVDAVTQADASGTPLLVLGGGSNLLVSDDGFDGLVVRDVRTTLKTQDDGFCGGVSLTAAAGVEWDHAVLTAVQEGWVGIEAMSGIPGSVGAAPVQNIGAYGAELADVLASVRVWDRQQRKIRTMFAIELGFGYRDSVLKRSLGEGFTPTPRYVVLDVTMHMRFGTRSAPVRYGQLASALGIELGETASTEDVRAAVLKLRSAKGMVLDAADHDTWSAGSFFTNPVVDEDQLPAGAPQFPAPGGVKTSAAWLIENAGFGKGFALSGSGAALSGKHTLALTNRGDATAADVVDLARHIRDGVEQAFGIHLVPEPVLVGVDL